MMAAPSLLEQAYEAIQRPVSIDYAVMEGAAQSGQVVMASMDVGWSDLGSWTALLAALGARGSGSVVQAGETVEVEHDDLIVRRIHGRLGVIAPPERGSMTATQPIADPARREPRPGARRAAPGALLRTGGLSVTVSGDPTDADPDRVRDRRLARPDRRRVHLRERPPLRGRGRALRGRPRREGQGRRRRLRPALRVASTSRRPPPRSCSRTTSRSPSRSTPCRPR